MRIYLEVASQVLVLIFVLSTLFSVGLLVSARQVLAALQQRRSLAVALFANFVVLPGAALALCWGLQLAPPMQAALLLVATAPGSPVLLRLNEFARGDQARAVGLLVLLMSLTLVYQPLVLPMLLPGLSVSPMPIARTLVLTVLLPLVLGLLLKARWPALAGRLRPALTRLGNISAALSCFILLPLVYRDALMDVALNGGGLLVLLLYLPLAVGAGWWLGGPNADQRRLLALCCGQGSMGAAFVIAAHNFNNPHVIAMLLLILWASLALLIPLALVFRRQSLGDAEDLSEKAIQRACRLQRQFLGNELPGRQPLGAHPARNEWLLLMTPPCSSGEPSSGTHEERSRQANPFPACGPTRKLWTDEMMLLRPIREQPERREVI